ncbi:tyrosine-type recombinase/integrase [Lacipirellula sp.]|uniref:tyrosine-type recombinase/integrase n=1 Tax=Lacipirellula sp. TaxID=2691419 RepID=UPI003D0E02F8
MATKKPPTVRMAKPKGRPIQLRYTCPEEGREIRISTGTTNEVDALEQKQKLEAKLLLGLEAKPRRRAKGGATMLWEDFRERYTDLHLSTLREKSAVDAESRLDVAERILKPRTLGDVANSESLHYLQQQLLQGAESRFQRPRSKVTARNYMLVITGALNWAAFMEWLPSVPKLKKLKIAKMKQMKGRPLTAEEFALMLKATEAIVGAAAAPSWRHTLRGLWASGLRLGELLHVHWVNKKYIVPAWPTDGLGVLMIPAAMQKNDTEESIPLLPEFERLLLKTPDDQRTGWVFNPLSLDGRAGRKTRSARPRVGWVSKIISDIGEKAGIVVNDDGKFASAHDLRRSCADRLISAGLQEREVAAVLRHASVETTRRHYSPGNVQRSASIIREALERT